MEKYVETDTGIVLYAESFGKPTDRPALLIMGAMNQGVFWPDAFCEELAAAGFHVVRYDHRDTGKSSCVDFSANPYDLDALTADALALIHEFKMQNPLIIGLSMGADDYVTKPYNTAELMARVKSQLRRYFSLGAANGTTQSQDILKNGGLLLNRNTKELLVDGEPVRLTATEYKIMELLMEHPGYVFSAEEIYSQVWQEDAYSVENTVMVHIRRIREKIEITPKNPKYLKVVWGIGYKIEKIDGN